MCTNSAELLSITELSIPLVVKSPIVHAPAFDGFSQFSTWLNHVKPPRGPEPSASAQQALGLSEQGFSLLAMGETWGGFTSGYSYF